jgi:hypothetical protein
LSLSVKQLSLWGEREEGRKKSYLRPSNLIYICCFPRFLQDRLNFIEHPFLFIISLTPLRISSLPFFFENIKMATRHPLCPILITGCDARRLDDRSNITM